MLGTSVKTTLVSNLACFAILATVIAVTVWGRAHRFDSAMHDPAQIQQSVAFAL